MRRRIDTSGIEFRVAGMPLPRTVSRENKAQKVTPDGRPVWVVKLTAFDPGVGPYPRTYRSYQRQTRQYSASTGNVRTCRWQHRRASCGASQPDAPA